MNRGTGRTAVRCQAEDKNVGRPSRPSGEQAMNETLDIKLKAAAARLGILAREE